MKTLTERTTLCAIVSAVFGFIAVSPEFFAHWPLLIAIAKYIAAGGLVSLGISAQDKTKPQ